MKNPLPFLLVLVLLPALATPAAEAPAPVLVPVLQSSVKAPVLDGRLDEAEWKDAAVLKAKGLDLRILRDGQALYLSLEVPTACTTQEELYLLLGAGASATPGTGDLQLGFAPLSIQRQPWTESKGDGKTWVATPTPSGWTAKASYALTGRLQIEFAVSLARIPSRTGLRLGALLSGERDLALPEAANLYLPDSWADLTLGEDVPAGDAKAFDQAFKTAETLDLARRCREAAVAARARHEELTRQEAPPKTQAERAALGQALEAADRSYAKACELEPANPVLHFDHASTLTMKGNLEAAIAELEETCRLAPGVARFEQRLYGTCMNAGRFTRCLQLAEAVVSAHPDRWDGWFLRGQARLMLQDYDGALADLEKASTFTLGAKLGQTLDRTIETAKNFQKAWAGELEARKGDQAKGDLPRAEIRTARGVLLVELLEDDAPQAVAWFIRLAEAKAFDGKPYLGIRDPGVLPERPEPTRRHWRGSLSLIPPTQQGAVPQFLLIPKTLPEYDGQCSVFGRVLEGVEIIDGLRPGEMLQSVRITRKRDHSYAPPEPPKQEPPQP